MREAKSFLSNPNFKGYISDVGGPTANFRRSSCEHQKKYGLCKGRKCLAPEPCPQLVADHSDYLHLLRSLRAVKGVKKVFIRSGIRYDYILKDPDDTFFKELVRYHISGQLRVAPEHCSNTVLDQMGKPHIEAYRRFQKMYEEETKRLGKEQYLVPYLMSSHPGSTLSDAIALAKFLKESHIHPDLGAGLLSYSRYGFNLYLLYGNKSDDRRERLCSQNTRRKSHAARAAAIL